jgi:hypothetical protein
MPEKREAATRKKPDDGLRQLLIHHIEAQWTVIKTWGVSRGVPDAEFCMRGGVQGWVECKSCRGNAVIMRPMQISWLMKRSLMGGNCFIAVRKRLVSGGKTIGDDELRIYRGAGAAALKSGGLEAASDYLLGSWKGGPGKWKWDEVQFVLQSGRLTSEEMEKRAK